MDLGLDGRVALVTGGSKGIGKAVARQLRAEGAQVAILARSGEELTAAAKELGDDTLPVTADTTDTAQVEAAVSRIVDRFGRLDVVVNAAATPASSSAGGAGLAGVDEADFHTQLDTKALGYLRVVRAAVPHLKAAGGGRIVNISGTNARTTGAITGSIRNLAVVALTKNLADELGQDNIAVTCVHPGMTRTEREFTEAMQAQATANALGRTVDATEVADLVTFLASPRATLANGAIITADGGRLGSIWT